MSYGFWTIGKNRVYRNGSRLQTGLHPGYALLLAVQVPQSLLLHDVIHHHLQQYFSFLQALGQLVFQYLTYLLLRQGLAHSLYLQMHHHAVSLHVNW